MRVSQVSKYQANWWDCSDTYCSPSTSVHHLLWIGHPPFRKSRLCRHRPRWLQSQELTCKGLGFADLFYSFFAHEFLQVPQIELQYESYETIRISYPETSRKATLTIELLILWSALGVSNHESWGVFSIFHPCQVASRCSCRSNPWWCRTLHLNVRHQEMGSWWTRFRVQLPCSHVHHLYTARFVWIVWTMQTTCDVQSWVGFFSKLVAILHPSASCYINFHILLGFGLQNLSRHVRIHRDSDLFNKLFQLPPRMAQPWDFQACIVSNLETIMQCRSTICTTRLQFQG